MSTSKAPGARGAVVGVGVDICDPSRIQTALARTPGLADRLFTPREREWLDPVAEAMAALFAAKEAVMKSLGVGLDRVSFTDIELDRGLERVTLSGRAADRAAELGALHWSVDVVPIEGPLGPLVMAEVVASEVPATAAGARGPTLDR